MYWILLICGIAHSNITMMRNINAGDETITFYDDGLKVEMGYTDTITVGELYFFNCRQNNEQYRMYKYFDRIGVVASINDDNFEFLDDKNTHTIYFNEVSIYEIPDIIKTYISDNAEHTPTVVH